MMLQATTVSGTGLGESEASLEINRSLAGYFQGGSLWQASVASVLPTDPSPLPYIATTAVLLGLLAGGATAVAAFVPARLGGFPADSVQEVRAIIDPVTSEVPASTV